MAFYKNAVLHRELHQAASHVTVNYLKKLSTVQGRDQSRSADLYLGEALIDSGRPVNAVIHLERFAADESMDARFRAFAKVGLGLCAYLARDTQKASMIWDAVDQADPEIEAELAAAFARAEVPDKDPVSMMNHSIELATKPGKSLSIRMVKNAVAVYARKGPVDRGIELLKRADRKAPSYRETLGKSKVINFYDLTLIGDMAVLYGRASIASLEKAISDPKTRSAAEFTLGQAHAIFGSVEQSMKSATAVKASSQMPQQYKDRMQAWQAANLHQQGRTAEARGIWDELARKQPADPDLLAEILVTCSRVRTECAAIAQQATASAEAGEGKKFMGLNAAIGRYLLGRQENARAVTFLEAGRDKSNKNKIEANEPVLLVDLADAYQRTKKFSEALEIYFEMSKHFPEVRQVQEALQGVYAMEHKSAGDVKIN
jgi:tetratricopeptide (TPR) repeat protein